MMTGVIESNHHKKLRPPEKLTKISDFTPAVLCENTPFSNANIEDLLEIYERVIKIPSFLFLCLCLHGFSAHSV